MWQLSKSPVSCSQTPPLLAIYIINRTFFVYIIFPSVVVINLISQYTSVIYQLGAETGVETELLHKMKVCVRVGCLMLVPLASFLPSVRYAHHHTHTPLFSLFRVSLCIGLPPGCIHCYNHHSSESLV